MHTQIKHQFGAICETQCEGCDSSDQKVGTIGAPSGNRDNGKNRKLETKELAEKPSLFVAAGTRVTDILSFTQSPVQVNRYWTLWLVPQHGKNKLNFFLINVLTSGTTGNSEGTMKIYC